MGAAKPFSEEAFRRLVHQLSPEQLRRFPAERLPRSIPLEAYEECNDPQKRGILDEFAWSVAAREVEDGASADRALDPALRQALELAESTGTYGVEELNRLTDELARLHPEQGESTLESDSARKLERVRYLARQAAGTVAELNRGLATLDQPFAGEERFRERVSAARLRSKQLLSVLETALGRYELVEMDIAHGAMRLKQQQCEAEAHKIRQLDEQIRVVRDKLARQGRLGKRLLQPRIARQQREYLMQRLQSLIRQRDGGESFVGEQDLLRWLDVLVEASLYVPHDSWQRRAQRTRLLLFRLLNVYCLQQETAAQQLATNPMLRVNSRDAIGYYLKSEQFILEYFSRKRQEVTLWLAGAAREKLDSLDRVRDAILADYRRCSRQR